MLNNTILVLLFVLFETGCIHAQKVKYSNLDTMKYEITIINYYNGRINKRTIITTNRLSYEKHINRGNSKKISRLLNPDEKIKMAEFLENFPLNQLDEEYVTNDVKDGTQMSFVININDELKEIFIGNVYQEDLGKLVKLIVSMLPEDLIQYRKELIYPY